MDIGIIGTGATGLLLAAFFADQDHQVTCYVNRNTQKDSILTNGIRILPYDKNFRVHASKLTDLKRHDIYIFCVKQPQLQSALLIVEEKVANEKPFLFLQNGMTHIELVKMLTRPVLIGILEHGARRINDFTVEHTGRGNIRIGSLKNEHQVLGKEIVKMLNSTSIPITQVDDWEQVLKEKLIVNAVINPLTAIFNIKNGEVLENEHVRKLASELCKEACQVLKMDFERMWEYVSQVANNTKENVSSMRSDILKHQETEIDSITGYILKESRIAVPYSQFVYEGIKAIEMRTS